MQIVLYQNNAERERVDKTGYLTELFSLTGTLKDDADVTSPIIVIDLASVAPELVSSDDDSEIQSSDDDAEIVSNDTNAIPTFNYAYIPEFKRYYFVSSLEVLKGNNTRHLYRMGLVCDLLMTYQTEIKSEHCLIARNEFNFSKLINDPSLPFKVNKSVYEFVPTRGSLANTTFSTNLGSYPANIVLNLVSDVTPYIADATPPLNSDLPLIPPEKFSSYRSSTPWVIDYTTFGEIAKNLMGDRAEDISFVKSVVAFPFLPEHEYSLVNQYIYFGDKDDPQNRMKDSNGNDIHALRCPYFSTYLVIADFNIPQAVNFYDFAPFAHYEIYIPFLGWRELDYQVVRGCRLIVYYSANYEDGSGEVYLYDMTNKRLIFSSAVQIGVKLAFSSTNAQVIEEQRNGANSALALSLIGSAVTGIASVGSGNIAGAVLAGVGGAKAIADYMKNDALRFDHASASFGGSTAPLYAPLEVHLRITLSEPLPFDLNAYAHAYGRPLMQFMNLGDVSGRTIASDIHLLNFSGLDDERNNIISLLESGVIL